MTDEKFCNEVAIYNSSIKKPFIGPLTDKKLLSEVQFYKGFLEELNITKCSKAFENYSRK